MNFWKISVDTLPFMNLTLLRTVVAISDTSDLKGWNLEMRARLQLFIIVLLRHCGNQCLLSTIAEKFKCCLPNSFLSSCASSSVTHQRTCHRAFNVEPTRTSNCLIAFCASHISRDRMNITQMIHDVCVMTICIDQIGN